MKLYERSIFVDIIETKLLQRFPEYYPQGQANSFFINYFYKYLSENVFSFWHYETYNQLLKLKEHQKDLEVQERIDLKTFDITSKSKKINNSVRLNLEKILQDYNDSYEYILKTDEKITIRFNYGWLPKTAISFLDIINNELLIDYHIEDNITLVPNTADNKQYVCYKIDSVSAYDTILFLVDKENIQQDISDMNITFATLLTDLQGSKGSTLNRVVTTTVDNAFYEVGPYGTIDSHYEENNFPNYLSTTRSSLIIQVPIELASLVDVFNDNKLFLTYNLKNSVIINHKNSEDVNNFNNWFQNLSSTDISKFTKLNVDLESINNLIKNSGSILSDLILKQYCFGDFIWKTSDSKLIVYAQNLVNYIYSANLKTNGVWSNELSEYIKQFKKDYNKDYLINDDVLDKGTEQLMLFKYQQNTGLDSNEYLFKEW